jgi:hypothetical protein
MLRACVYETKEYMDIDYDRSQFSLGYQPNVQRLLDVVFYEQSMAIEVFRIYEDENRLTLHSEYQMWPGYYEISRADGLTLYARIL